MGVKFIKSSEPANRNPLVINQALNRGRRRVSVDANPTTAAITKSEVSTGKDEHPTELGFTINSLLPTPFDIHGLQMMVENSTILQQCITAYRRNIVGFGAEPQYRKNQIQERKLDQQAQAQGLDTNAEREGQEVDDEGQTTPTDPTAVQFPTRAQPTPATEPDTDGDEQTKETPEMAMEWDRIQDFTEYFSFTSSFEEIMGQLVEDREVTGNFYCELIRDGAGKVVEGVRLNPRYMQCTVVGDDFQQVELVRNGRVFHHRQQFRRYCQVINASRVWFRELGDPRPMDNRTGEYLTPAEALKTPDQYLANEIWHDRIGSGAYGMPRWIGQLVHMYGSRKAEELNLRYFENGRHIPMAIVVSNGSLTPQTEDEIQQYVDSIEGVKNAYGFLVVEAEGTPSDLVDGKENSAKIELKSLADVIQKDALFLEYDAKSREKVQSAFALPDIYVGRSADFNRATADTAKEITEEQVFGPERNHLEWHINRRILAEYGFQFAELKFKKPAVSSIDEFVQVADLLVTAGSVTANELRGMVSTYLGKTLESLGSDYDKPVVKQSGGSGGFGTPGAPTAGPTTPTEDPNPFASLMLSAAQPGQELQKALNQPDVKEQLARSREDSMLRLLADMRAAKEGD